MNLAPHELMFVGACIGWIACALCFWLIPSWRTQDIVSLDDDALLRVIQDSSAEWIYRNPEMKAAYAQALRAGDAIARSHSSGEVKS